MPWILCLAAVLPLILPPAAPAPRVLASREALYLEDAVMPRPVALVRAELVGIEDARWLRLRLSAIGAGVDAVPGLEGVPGANLRTAEELDRLLREGRLAVTVEPVAGERTTAPANVTAIEWRRLPARRVAITGIDFESRTTAEWPAAVTMLTARLPLGEVNVYLEADGLPRLLAVVAEDRVTQLTSLRATVISTESSVAEGVR
ncbi:MAG: hypothetical protein NXI31_09395 [bacterium]|nr:hypothetical protein [bacterium]